MLMPSSYLNKRDSFDEIKYLLFDMGYKDNKNHSFNYIADLLVDIFFTSLTFDDIIYNINLLDDDEWTQEYR